MSIWGRVLVPHDWYTYRGTMLSEKPLHLVFDRVDIDTQIEEVPSNPLLNFLGLLRFSSRDYSPVKHYCCSCDCPALPYCHLCPVNGTDGRAPVRVEVKGRA